MMRTILIQLAAGCLALNGVIAQKPQEKVYYKDVHLDGNEFYLLAKDGVSTAEFTKFNVKITNKTQDILWYKASESRLNVEGKTYTPSENPLEIGPGEKDGLVVDFKGPGFRVTSYAYEMGGLYKIPLSSGVLQTKDLSLPPSQNEFKTGNFTCNMLEFDRKTGAATIKFECRYTGDKVGVIMPARARLKLQDGTVLANHRAKDGPIVIEQGNTRKFSCTWKRKESNKELGMDKIAMTMIWNDVFLEDTATPLSAPMLDFRIDEVRSKK
jgi:hypothetical protein